jgi:hypothetical protein
VLKPHLTVVRTGDLETTQSFENWVADLRGVVWHAFVREARTLEDIAVSANLHALTVERFAWGDTKRPALRTALQLAQAVGFRVPLISSSAPRQPDEASLSWTRPLLQTRARA